MQNATTPQVTGIPLSDLETIAGRLGEHGPHVTIVRRSSGWEVTVFTPPIRSRGVAVSADGTFGTISATGPNLGHAFLACLARCSKVEAALAVTA